MRERHCSFRPTDGATCRKSLTFCLGVPSCVIPDRVAFLDVSKYFSELLRELPKELRQVIFHSFTIPRIQSLLKLESTMTQLTQDKILEMIEMKRVLHAILCTT